MTAASFALLQALFYLFSARIGCRASQKRHYFRSAPRRKSHRTRGGVTARAANLSFPAMALGADWLSGLPKKPIIFVPLRAASPIGRAAVSQRVLQIYLYLPWFWARIGCRGSPKNLLLSFRSEPQVPSDARRCHSACREFIFTCHGFGRGLAVGASRKKAYFRFALSRKSHRTRGGVTARAVIFPLPPQRFARICCRASRPLRLRRERAWRWQPLRNRQCSHRQPDCPSCRILRQP